MSTRIDMMWGLNTPGYGEMRRERDEGRAYEYLILRIEGVGEVGKAVPEALVMNGAVKIFTLNTALWDMSSRERERKEEEEEESSDVLPSIVPFPQSLLPSSPSNKVGQHYTSV